MVSKQKRFSVTLKPEWDKRMTKLKKSKFYDKSQSEMIRYLIERGLAVEETNAPTA